MKIPYLTLIVPVYNEEKILEKNIRIIHKFLKNLKKSFEIIIADDGSTDDTYDIIKKLSRKYKEVRYIHYDNNVGRGNALTTAFKVAKGKIQGYIDADLSININIIPEMLDEIEKNSDVVIGSKHLKESRIKYPPIRRLFSKGYSFLTRILLGVPVRDYMCGLKFFRLEAMQKLLNQVKNTGWFWDTEIIVKAWWSGYKIKEIPVIVEETTNESTVNLYRDVKRMSKELISLFNERLKYSK